MFKTWKMGIFAALAIFGLASASRADPISYPDLSTIIGLTMEVAEGPPSPRRTTQPTAILPDAMPSIPPVRAYGVPVRLTRKDQARAEQLAYFIDIYRIERNGDEVRVVYGHPAAGMEGDVTIVFDGRSWRITDHRPSHSSSGARSYYGHMYEGVTCRDGTEMAVRWNGNAEMMEAIQAGRSAELMAALRGGKPLNSGPASGKCRGPEFPEVAIYREMQAQRRGERW